MLAPPWLSKAYSINTVKFRSFEKKEGKGSATTDKMDKRHGELPQ